MLQIGCMGGENQTICHPDDIASPGTANMSIVRTFNGETVTLDNNTMVFYTRLDFVDVTIEDSSVKTISDPSFEPWYANASQDHFAHMPLQEGDVTTYHFDDTLTSQYFSAGNISTGIKKSVIPMDGFYKFIGWKDSSTAIFQWSDVKIYLLTVTDSATMAYTLNIGDSNIEPETTSEISPDGDYEIELTNSKTWTGDATFTLLKNSDGAYHIQTAMLFTNGTDTYEQTSDENYKIVPAYCEEVFVSAWD